MPADKIIESLEQVADRVGDPTPLVYDRLFAAQPEMRALFTLDSDNSVKGNMLAQLIDAMIDLAGEGHYARGLIQTEVVNHNNLGVPPEVFVTFVDTVVATFREALGADWTADYDRAWGELAREFSEMLEDRVT
jgi:hemoglobin-like flavoprotein